jgi:hypothetical protein
LPAASLPALPTKSASAAPATRVSSPPRIAKSAKRRQDRQNEILGSRIQEETSVHSQTLRLRARAHMKPRLSPAPCSVVLCAPRALARNRSGQQHKPQILATLASIGDLGDFSPSTGASRTRHRLAPRDRSPAGPC